MLALLLLVPLLALLLTQRIFEAVLFCLLREGKIHIDCILALFDLMLWHLGDHLLYRVGFRGLLDDIFERCLKVISALGSFGEDVINTILFLTCVRSWGLLTAGLVLSCWNFLDDADDTLIHHKDAVNSACILLWFTCCLILLTDLILSV